MKTEKLVNLSVFQGLIPFNAMPPKLVEPLTRSTYLEIAQAEEALFTDDTPDPFAYYILSGVLTLAYKGKASQSRIGGTPESRSALSQAKEPSCSAIAKTSVIFFPVPLTTIAPYLPRAGEPAKIPIDTDAEVIKLVGDEIDRALKSNKLIIPSLPDVAEKVREAVRDPGIDSVAVSKIIQADPPLAARIVQVANSPLYRGSASITNCRVAVSRLGLKVTRDLVVGCSLQHMFKTDHPCLQQELTDQWRQSTLVGAISFILARLVPHLDSDRAMLAGLLHNIGALPIIAYASNYPPLINNEKWRRNSIRQLAPKVGEQMLRRWKFDGDLISAVAGAIDWFRDASLKADYCDVIQLTQLYSFIDTPDMANYPTLDQIPAFLRVPIGRLGPRMTVKVLEEARSDIAELQKLLGSA